MADGSVQKKVSIDRRFFKLILIITVLTYMDGKGECNKERRPKEEDSSTAFLGGHVVSFQNGGGGKIENGVRSRCNDLAAVSNREVAIQWQRS